MKHKYMCLFYLSIALFILSGNNKIKAQIVSQSDRANNSISKYQIMLPIPGEYRIEIENNPIINKRQSALEVLRAIPGVFIKDTKIEIIGKNNLLIQVNGLDKNWNTSQMADYLSTISGDIVKEVEVIYNPSVEYAPAGSIINIITKNSPNEGSTINLKASTANLNKYWGSIDYSLVKPKSNFSLSIADNYNKTFSNSEFITSYKDNPPSKDQIETFSSPDISLNKPSVNFKYNYKVNDHHTIGGSLDYWENSYTNNVTNMSHIRIKNPYDTLNQKKKGNTCNSSIDLYSITKFKNLNQLDLKLNIISSNMNDSYIIHHESTDYELYKKYLSEEQAYTLKAIYKLNLFKKIVCETGTEFEYKKLRDYLKDTLIRNWSGYNFTNEDSKSFKSDKYVATAFLNFNISLKSWNYTFVLREEFLFYNTFQKGHGETYNENKVLTDEYFLDGYFKIKNNYLYPTTSISYIINKKQLITLVVKQNNTIPYFKFYQPYIYQVPTEIKIEDTYNISPSKATLADLFYILQPSSAQMYVLNGGISYYKKIIYPSILSETTTIKQMILMFNLSDMKKMYVSISSQNVFNKWFSIGTSIEVSETKYLKYNNLSNLYLAELPNLGIKHLDVALSLNGNIHLPKQVNFNFLYQYESSGITPQGTTSSVHFLNLVFDHSFKNNKINTFLSITNPFHSMTRLEEYKFSYRKIQYRNISELAVLRLGISYRFGKDKKESIL